MLATIGIFALGYGSLFVVTQADMGQAKKALLERNSPAEFFAKFGEPKATFIGRDALPPIFQPVPSSDTLTNAIFHVIAREGLPYWSILIAVDASTSNFLWGTIARPY